MITITLKFTKENYYLGSISALLDNQKPTVRKCILTKERTHSLVVHHLKSFNTILDEASYNTGIPVLQKLADYENEEYIQLTNEVIRLHDVNNGVTLTKEIHDLFHEIYGRGDNTPEQFKEFTRRFQAGEFEVKHNE